MRKHEREIRQIARSLGGQVGFRNGGHLVIELPNGKTYFVANSPSDQRARRNLLADLKKLAAE